MREPFIKEQREFDRIIKAGQQANSPIGRIKFLKNGVDKPKLGIILGKKQGLTAVKRNRIRRIIKEAWRLVIPSLSVPVEVVIFPKNNIFAEKSTKIERFLLQAIGDICGPGKANKSMFVGNR